MNRSGKQTADYQVIPGFLRQRFGMAFLDLRRGERHRMSQLYMQRVTELNNRRVPQLLRRSCRIQDSGPLPTTTTCENMDKEVSGLRCGNSVKYKMSSQKIHCSSKLFDSKSPQGPNYHCNTKAHTRAHAACARLFPLGAVSFGVSRTCPIQLHSIRDETAGRSRTLQIAKRKSQIANYKSLSFDPYRSSSMNAAHSLRKFRRTNRFSKQTAR